MNKSLLIIIICMVGMCSFNLKAQITYDRLDTSFYSVCLDTTKNIVIYIPREYWDDLEKEFPVIYHLHGANGNQGDGNSYAMHYYGEHYSNDEIIHPPAIMVCPDGSCEPYGGSAYVNSVLYGNYEDYIIQDVILFVEDNYRVKKDKNFRFLSGLSMGGFGTAHLGTKYPEMFRGCFPLSGFLSIPDTFLNKWKSLLYYENGWSYNFNVAIGGYTQLFFTMCGALSPNMDIEPYHIEIPIDTMGNFVDTVLSKWDVYDASRRVRDLPNDGELDWFLGCGTIDVMATHPTYLVFMDSLNAYNIPYKTSFDEYGHWFDSEVWRAGMQWMDSLIAESYFNLGVEIIANEEFQINVFPNPVLDQLNIDFEIATKGEVRIFILNILGGVELIVDDSWYCKGKYSHHIDLRNFDSSVYLIRVETPTGTTTKNILKI